jgi:heat shock protein HslJ
MKLLNIFPLFLVACSFTLESQAQKTSKVGTPTDKIIGIYWMTAQEKEANTSRKQGFSFSDSRNFTGYDGCNSFYGSFTYSEKEGFRIKNIITTELECIEKAPLFQTGFFYSAKSFEVKQNELFFYDAHKKEVARFVSFTNPDKKELPVPTGDWKMVDSNHQYFQTVQQAKREPYLRLLKDRRFVVCYNNDKSKSWTEVNYFAGYCNANEKQLFFQINANASVLSMPEGEDSYLAQSLQYAQTWEMKGKQLVIKNGETYFVFEKLP